MSTQTGKWREDQILVICPGSQTTMAQLGCAELTPPAFRIPTRMFKDDEEEDSWRPVHTYKRRKANAVGKAASNGGGAKGDDDEWEYVEDPDSDEGAVYPIQAGRIANMECFLAFLEHVHAKLTTTYHNTPIVLMASPQWTRPDCEDIARYIFEKTKTPSLCLLHSGVATQYGLRWPNMTVVDIGYEKVDVTCIYDSRVVSHKDVGAYPSAEEREISGGEVFTRKLLSLLEGKGFNREMAEQLKKSAVCEVLPYVPDSPKLMELPAENVGPAGVPAAAAPVEPPKIIETAPLTDDDGLNGDKDVVDEDGVLNIANIITSGNTREFLAKKEKEKAEKAKPGRKAKEKAEVDAAAARARLPNSKRTWNMFHYEDFVTEDVPVAPPAAPAPVPTKDVEMGDGAAPADTAAATADGAATAPTGEAKSSEPRADQIPAAAEGDAAPKPETAAPPESTTAQAAPTESAPPASEGQQQQLTEKQTKRVRRDIEVGLERFLFADRAEIDRIATAIYQAVQGIQDMYMRPPCWENIVFVGNGARIRGLKDNIMQTLQARHLVSPSSATMFTSELPSNMGTPSGTGSQTPTGSFTGAPHQLPTTSSVNPLLQAATTASLGVPGGPLGVQQQAGSNAGDMAPSHHFHSQTPTNIKLAAMPNYLSEWSKNGFEEAMFLGAQIAARLAFCIHNLDQSTADAQRLMSLSRVDYNELGPKGIRSHSMLA
ncbi:hypothetical protein B0H66DRAFT_476052 [Apodospora peruviana]|uniref:Actin-related protein n=1 Tax=Apodospora peruviana TaxID=516989 RepID=A0AAE0I7U5_9PEZI|nr:hypothetical protein B0H66DRAFT_476052 [Apodospora peruviana]